MKGFAVIASPLAKLLRKGVKFEWTNKCQDSFEQLKEMLVESILRKGGNVGIDAAYLG